MFDDIPSSNDFPEYDQYDENYVLQTQTKFTEQSVASLEDEKMHFQQMEYRDSQYRLVMRVRKKKHKIWK